jgi:hypothetical protein
VKAKFVFATQNLAGQAAEPAVFENVKPSRDGALQLKKQTGGEIRLVLLSDADSLALQKTAAGQIAFEKPPEISRLQLKADLLKPAGPAREIPLSNGKSPIARAPTDADFTNAAVWKIRWPKKWSMDENTILRIRYVGDAARLVLNGKLVEDNFYCGREFDLGLERYAEQILQGDELRLEILPLSKNAPVFFEPKAKPDFGAAETLLKLQSVEIIDRSEVEFKK